MEQRRAGPARPTTQVTKDDFLSHFVTFCHLKLNSALWSPPGRGGNEAETVQKSNPAPRTGPEPLTAALSYSAFRQGDGVQSVLLHYQIRHTTNCGSTEPLSTRTHAFATVPSSPRKARNDRGLLRIPPGCLWPAHHPRRRRADGREQVNSRGGERRLGFSQGRWN
jgi:hypothetical protein